MFIPPLRRYPDAGRGGGAGKTHGAGLSFSQTTITAHRTKICPTAMTFTLLPGTEWTHYKGHAGFLWRKRGFPASLFHRLPGRNGCTFPGGGGNARFPYHQPSFLPSGTMGMGLCPSLDGLEVEWRHVRNGMKGRQAGMSSCIAGRRIPWSPEASDYHRPGLLGSLAMPCHCLYAPLPFPARPAAGAPTGNGFYFLSALRADGRPAGRGHGWKCRLFGDFCCPRL